MNYDGIIVGAGHAGVEAALAMARMNKKILVVTGNLNKVAFMPCNPSIGGPAKGVVVREIDALGGQMGISSDQNQIQIKMLNKSKGPAVYALRAQIDKLTYPRFMLKVLQEEKNITLKEGLVESLIIEDNICKGVRLYSGESYNSKTTVITTGTYLSSNILIGPENVSKGPVDEPTTKGISAQLDNLGIELMRLKTGTPPRLLKSSIDYSKMEIQLGDNEPLTFSFTKNYRVDGPKEPCYLIHTNLITHQVLFDHMHESPMYSGAIKGAPTRYCPSIEDKVKRFDNDRHQLFLEPESLELNEIYLQGLSTSMPKHVQEKLLTTIPGLENAKIVRYGYAIEYDAINPLQLKVNLELKQIENLFSAGQINGTSGYEEAACQGLMAGINASLKIDKKEPFVLNRDEAYIGVLIDDLVTKGTKEPYRLLTSRAEHRLILRHDNADQRLSKKGYEIGLLTKERYLMFEEKLENIKKLNELLETTYLYPTNETNELLAKLNSAPLYEKMSVFSLFKRPELTIDEIPLFINHDFDKDVLEQVLINIKYAGYINKANKSIEKFKKMDNKLIPEIVDYKKITNLSLEAKEKLIKVQPRTIGQASRISGVSPADISQIVIYIESGKYQND